MRDELYQIYFGHPQGRLNAGLTSEMGIAVVSESFDARNVTLPAEYVEGIDVEQFAPRKPLIWFWQMFDRSPLGLNHWLGLRFRCMLGRHIFEHLGAPLWAAKTSRELAQLATRASAGGLTETERRVAALVTQGHTNREVAAAMFVTENTVQTHLRHIFRKLSVRSRTELTVLFLAAPANTVAIARPRSPRNENRTELIRPTGEAEISLI